MPEPYELIYWPAIPGRAEFIRLVFEEAGVAYTDVAKGEDMNETVNTVISLPSKDPRQPIFAVPALRHDGLLLSQTSNILLYLAPQFDLSPAAGSADFYQLNQIVLTLLNAFVEELHDTHHPIAVEDPYEDQQTEARRRAGNFIENRLPKFLAYLQRLLEAETSGDGPWVYGDGLTYADLVIFQCVDGTKFAFPKTMDGFEKSGKYDDVFKLYGAVKERPNIKAYLASERRRAYSNGIWRHYPELEDK
jgi:glutathione S-transferase